jgi:arsenate reductase (thioredoxin)
MIRKRVLFVCTHNSARSQMAEAMVNAWAPDAFEAFSAGTDATAIRPETIQVMADIGLDLDGQWSKSIDEFRGQPFHWFITVCDEAQKNCPVLPGVPNVAHWSIEDPSHVQGTPDEKLEAFRTARDRLRDRIHIFLLAAGRDDLAIPDTATLG